MKNIILCSDGTGNKGGYGEDTNVYKVYKAVDIHNEKIEQITFYDQGVGTDKSDTNKNKYRTALSGAFGFGFEANVLHLYHFLARSYSPGDSVFLFGFSRGAATVRAFAGFINACGLIDRNDPSFQKNGFFDEDEFRKRVNEAFICYKSDKIAQDTFKNKYALKDQDYAPNGNLKIKFIGVWDTVSALGFPKDFSKAVEWFFDLADRLSDKIWPHSFYDYELNPSIENAYHALSIDDERTTFHPKVWNEKNLAVWDEIKGAGTGHVEQVWFAGVHSNVGGGYPRTGLSDVALDWMITKAEAHGLIICNDHKTEIKESANLHDKLYDSRDGVALYYRYGPRNLEEFCQDKLRGKVAIHVSAYEKIKDISDAYAPDGLPSRFDVVDIDRTAPAAPAILRAVNVAPAEQETWTALKAEMVKYIKNRELLYRVFVEVTMLILIVSGILWTYPPESVIGLLSSPKGGFLANVADILKYFTPVYFENFITYVVCVQPLIFPVMLAVLFFMNRLRKRFTDKLDVTCREMCALLPPLFVTEPGRERSDNDR